MSRKGWAALVAAVGAVVLVAAMAAFQPWKLWVDDRANDADVAVAPAVPGQPQDDGKQAPQGPEKVYEGGKWRSYSHGETTGTVKLYKQPDGSHLLRLEDLRTSNGPDVKVVLAEQSFDQVGQLPPGYLTLATLKGNTGSSNYAIPAGTDITKYKSAVIWCKRFDAVFAAVSIT
ncbi:DM13 domain-containing protein [Actinocorallia longicatena]|uniref:DM13 domain-containing protein n=1 Tax=Actinocorallia longicatena TaxID=111803 RepID=A0ABP6Q7X1_9ACTN